MKRIRRYRQGLTMLACYKVGLFHQRNTYCGGGQRVRRR